MTIKGGTYLNGTCICELSQIMKNRMFIATTLANDPHTEGMRNAARIAEMVGIRTLLMKPSLDYDNFFSVLKEYQPHYIGLSYRLTPEIGLQELEKILNLLVSTGLLTTDSDVKIIFAGLPQTIKLVKERMSCFPLKIELCEQYPDIERKIEETVDYFDIKERRREIIKTLIAEARPEGVPLLDELADEVVSHDKYREEPSLPVPSLAAMNSYAQRIKESPIPVLRTHFGIPALDIMPTVDGIQEIANARVVDEISLGSSDLSQRYFGHPEMFVGKKNDGGVPYKTLEDLRKLYQASRTGNFPSVKPYCHVTDIVNFVDQCVSIGLLKGAHQAIPLYWFNELDGRGPKTVRESIREHFEGVRRLVKYGIPVEMNDPNQWSSRHAHDTLIVASYALIASVMTMCGVRDMVFQMQFNKPKETGDYADLAKMFAGMEIAEKISRYSSVAPNIIRETRAGIEHLSPDMAKAKWQLARTTLLQMLVRPHVIHLVSYCEANYAARPKDIIDSSKLVRRAVRIFKENEPDVLASVDMDVVRGRKDYLLKEVAYLLDRIARFNPSYKPVGLEQMAPLLGDPDVIADSIERKVMAAPGIINPKYRADYLTKPMRYGMINLVDDYNHPSILTEKQRLNMLTDKK